MNQEACVGREVAVVHSCPHPRVAARLALLVVVDSFVAMVVILCSNDRSGDATIPDRRHSKWSQYCSQSGEELSLGATHP